MVMKVLLLSIGIITNHLPMQVMDGFLGKMFSGSGAGNLGISTSATGLCMSVSSSGTTNFAFAPTGSFRPYFACQVGGISGTILNYGQISNNGNSTHTSNSGVYVLNFNSNHPLGVHLP
jgi:hypothetical protein